MSLKPYSEYKDSGVEWLGLIPSHWAMEPLKRSTYIKARVGWKGLKSDEYLEFSDAYLVTGTDFNNKFIEWESCHQVDFERYRDDPYIQLQNGDLLMTKDGTIGKLAVVSGLDKPACLNSGIFLLRPEKAYSTEYLYRVLSSNVFKQFVELTSYGSTIKHLYQNVLVDFVFGVPPKSEQQVITNFLDRETAEIDTFIADQEQLIELLEERRAATITHAVTKGLDPNAPMRDSGIKGLGDIPEHWISGPVKRFFVSLDSRRIPLSSEERSYRQGPFPYYGASGIIDMIDDFLFDEPLVLVSEDGANLNLRSTPIAFVARGKYWVNNHAHILRPRNEAVYFWAERLEALDVSPWTTGAAQPKLTAEALMNLEIAVPPSLAECLNIQEHILQETNEIDAAVGDAREAIALSKERRAALISAAVTGQIDVSQHDLPVVEARVDEVWV